MKSEMFSYVTEHNLCLRKGNLQNDAITAAQCGYSLEVSRSKEPRTNIDYFCQCKSCYTGQQKGV